MSNKRLASALVLVAFAFVFVCEIYEILFHEILFMKYQYIFLCL